MRPLPGRPQRDAGSKPYYKVNGTLTALIKKYTDKPNTHKPETKIPRFSPGHPPGDLPRHRTAERANMSRTSRRDAARGHAEQERIVTGPSRTNE